MNVENANGTSICAERNAIANAIAAGYKKGDIKKIYLMLSSGEFGTPCFACRQVLLEFMNKEDLVISVNKDGLEKVYTIEELYSKGYSKEEFLYLLKRFYSDDEIDKYGTVAIKFKIT